MNPVRSSPNGLSPERGREGTQRVSASCGLSERDVKYNNNSSSAPVTYVNNCVVATSYGMKSLLDEIRQQPEHIRHIFMWLCVVITFSVVGFVWFRSTSRQFVALMNPKAEQERILAEKNKPKQPSPFATIFSAWDNLQANISELFVGSKSNLEINNGASRTEKVELSPQKLPISE